MRKRGAVYSGSRRLPAAAVPLTSPVGPQPPPPKVAAAKKPSRLPAALAILATLLIAVVAWLTAPSLQPEQAARAELPEKPATNADAYERVRGSVVLVRGSPYDGTE